MTACTIYNATDDPTHANSTVRITARSVFVQGGALVLPAALSIRTDARGRWSAALPVPSNGAALGYEVVLASGERLTPTLRAGMPPQSLDVLRGAVPEHAASLLQSAAFAEAVFAKLRAESAVLLTYDPVTRQTVINTLASQTLGPVLTFDLSDEYNMMIGG